MQQRDTYTALVCKCSSNLHSLKCVQKQKTTLFSKQGCTFLSSNACCILAWRRLHFISKNMICFFPSLKSTLRSFEMEDVAVIYLLFWQWPFLDKVRKPHFFVAFVTVPFLGYFRKALTFTYCVYEYMVVGACERSIQFFTGIVQISCDLLQMNVFKPLKILYSWIFIGDFFPRLHLPFMKWIISS